MVILFGLIVLNAFLFVEVKSIETPKIIGINEILSVNRYSQFYSVSVVHFKVPNDVKNVSFVLIADIEKKSSFLTLGCKPPNITVYMQQGALPVIAPDNSKFPSTFVKVGGRADKIYRHFLANGTKNYINITSPVPGDWFGVIFQDWTPKKDDRIYVPEMTKKCKCILSTYAIVTIIDIDTININIPLQLQFINEKLLKLQLNDRNVDNLNTSCISKQLIHMYVASNSIPANLNQTFNITFEPNKLVSFAINPKLFSMQYILLKSDWNGSSIINCNFYVEKNGNKSFAKNFTDMENKEKTNSTYYLPERQFGWQLSTKRLIYDQYDFIKLSSSKILTFAYILKPNLELKSPKLINLTSPLTIFKFSINDLSEIGGTLYLGFTLNPLRNISAMPYLTVICLRRNAIELPSLPNKCVYFNEVYNTTLLLNSSSPIGTYENIHIPYPEMGTWYLSIGLFNYTHPVQCVECMNVFQTCAQFCENNYCASKCLQIMKENLPYNECNRCNITLNSWNNEQTQNLNVTLLNASVIFSISVSPCIDDSCGPNGDCRLMAENNIIFSTCDCNNDFIGWDCSDDSQTVSKLTALIGLLLLTLSNLGFLLSIYVALKRFYYTEALTYAFCMCFSLMYHLCDSGYGIYTYCLLPMNVLKFCDFFCGLLSIWVTLIAMADLRTELKSVSHIFGVILLILGILYNMESILVFVIPVTIGIFIFTTSWTIQCYKTQHLYPNKTYLRKYLPIGILCVCIGIVCFGLLETHSNYQYTHSTWHVLMALSIIMILPKPSAFKT